MDGIRLGSSVRGSFLLELSAPRGKRQIPDVETPVQSTERAGDGSTSTARLQFTLRKWKRNGHQAVRTPGRHGMQRLRPAAPCYGRLHIGRTPRKVSDREHIREADSGQESRFLSCWMLRLSGGSEGGKNAL